MPTLALTINYWLHLLATTAWLGGLITMVMVAWPGLSQAIGDSSDENNILYSLEKRFRPVANISLVVLLVTGMIQMGGDTHYEGLLQINSPWSLSLLGKHIIVALMILVGGIMQWGLHPAIERTRLQAKRKPDLAHGNLAGLHKKLRRLMTVNLVLGILVLLFTAYMTAL